jgi:hypothetical protein
MQDHVMIPTPQDPNLIPSIHNIPGRNNKQSTARTNSANFPFLNRKMRALNVALLSLISTIQSVASAPPLFFVYPVSRIRRTNKRHLPIFHPLLSTLVSSDSTVYQAANSDDEPTVLPPHTALAQVLANQYNIDLSTVEPRSKSRDKVTAADVEFHAYKLSQPPCTPQALELAYSYGLDLNILYEEYIDDETEEDQTQYLKISDVELLKDNLRSLRASRQRIQGRSGANIPADLRRKQKHLNELETRMEKNVVQLSEKAMQAVGTVAGILQTFQSSLPVPGDMFGLGDSKVDSVQDFDRELADEIQAALLSAGIDDEETMNLISLLDMPLNGSSGAKVDGNNGFSQRDTGNNNDENKEAERDNPAFFFADPK